MKSTLNFRIFLKNCLCSKGYYTWRGISTWFNVYKFYWNYSSIWWIFSEVQVGYVLYRLECYVSVLVDMNNATLQRAVIFVDLFHTYATRWNMFVFAWYNFSFVTFAKVLLHTCQNYERTLNVTKNVNLSSLLAMSVAFSRVYFILSFEEKTFVYVN